MATAMTTMLTQGPVGDGDYGNDSDHKVNTRYSICRHQFKACNFKQMLHLILKRHMYFYSFTHTQMRIREQSDF